MYGPLDYMATSDPFDYLGGFFMDNEFWTFSNYGGGTFVELGITNNANAWGINPCGCTAYYAFWGDYAPPVYGTHWFGHFIANISPNQSTYYGEVYNNSGSNNWTVYMNYNGTPYYGTSTHMYSNTAYDEILGSEEVDGDSASYDGGYGSLIDADESTGGQTFNNALEVDINNTWSFPPKAGYTNTDACGSGSGYVPNGYCDNGTNYGTNGAWWWNKP